VTLFPEKREESKEKKKRKGEVEEDRVNSKEIFVYLCSRFTPKRVIQK
jgi:hypothetical protein